MKTKTLFQVAALAALALIAGAAHAVGIDLSPLLTPEVAGGLMLANGVAALDVTQYKQLAETQTLLLDNAKEMKKWFEKANGEIEAIRKMEPETKAALEKLATTANDLTEKCLQLERKLAAGFEEGAAGSRVLDIGDQFVKSDMVKAIMAKQTKFARMELKAAIINATGQNQPLVADMRVPGIITQPNRLFTVRDLLPVGRTSSNLIQYTRENVFTNNAGPQYASPAFENVTKPESGITFTLANAPVVTLAHWIPVSRQVLDDAPQLQSYVNGRLMYGLKLEEEDQLLNGSGTSGNIGGLLLSGNNVAYNRAVTGDTKIDALRRSITQAALSEYPVDSIVMNPEDWEEIELTKTTEGAYIMANPTQLAGPQLWGRRIVPTNSIAAGTFLTGAFSMGAQLWDRMDAAVQISYEDGDNFKKNMATLLAEERLALTVYRPAAFIKGAF